MRRLTVIALLLAAAAGAFGLGWFVAKRTTTPHSDGASSAANTPTPPRFRQVVAQGRLVPNRGIYNVMIPPGQRVETLKVQVGDAVVGGKTELAVLASDSLLRKQIELAIARRADGKLELEQQLLRADQQVLAAQAALETARLQLLQAQQQAEFSLQQQRIEQASAKLLRYEALLADPDTARLISAYELEDQRLELEAARLQLHQAQKIAAQSIATAELAVANAEQQVTAAQQSQAAARAALESLQSLQIAESIARMQWESQRVLAPTDGTVLRIFVKPGEAVQNTPLMQIGDLRRMECVAEVSDRLVTLVQPDQSVTIRAPALEQPLVGHVRQIDGIVGPGTLIDPNPLAMVDKRTVEVRIELDTESSERARRLVNLQVTVEIDLSPLP